MDGGSDTQMGPASEAPPGTLLRALAHLIVGLQLVGLQLWAELWMLALATRVCRQQRAIALAVGHLELEMP